MDCCAATTAAAPWCCFRLLALSSPSVGVGLCAPGAAESAVAMLVLKLSPCSCDVSGCIGLKPEVGGSGTLMPAVGKGLAGEPAPATA